MSAVEVEFFTVDHAIRGYIENADERLSDIMNNRKESGVVLTDAYMIRLYNAGKTPPPKILEVNVHKDEVLFARPVQQDLTHKSLYRRATRRLYQVVVDLPPFEIQGVIHLTGRLDVARVLIERPDNFVPLTNAKALYMFNPRIEIVSHIFVVNKHKVAMIAQIYSEMMNPNRIEDEE